jgi:hypothetical protein
MPVDQRACSQAPPHSALFSRYAADPFEKDGYPAADGGHGVNGRRASCSRGRRKELDIASACKPHGAYWPAVHARRAHAREETAIIGPVSADASLLTLNWIQHWSPFPASVFGSESVLVDRENATNSGTSTSCSSPFRSTNPGTRNTGGVSPRRTERLIAGDVLSDGFVEPTCGIESACCALQMQ